MYCKTLTELRNSVDNMIAKYGEDSPAAAFIYVKEDVTYEDDDCNKVALSDEVIRDALARLGTTDYIYETANEILWDCTLEALDK